MDDSTNEYIITDSSNNKFIVKNKDKENFLCYKVLEDGSLVNPTEEELLFVIEQLQKQLKETEEKNKNQPKEKTLDDYFSEIMGLIDDGTILDDKALLNYIYQLELSDQEKQELYNKGINYMQMKMDNSEIIKFKNDIIEVLRRSKKEGTSLITDFNVKGNITGEQLCKVSLTAKNQNREFEMKSFTFYYTDELKKELIEPILQEIVMASRLTVNNLTDSNETFGYRSDYKIGTENRAYANLTNIEKEYGDYLKKMTNSLSNEGIVNDPNTRDSKIDNMKNEREQELEEPLKLIRKNDLNGEKGSSAIPLIYAIIAGSTAIVTLIQILISK